MVQTEIIWHGGAETVIDEVMSRLSERHDTKLFALTFDPAGYTVLDKLDRYVPKGRTAIRGHLRRHYEKRKYLNLAEAIRHWSPDIILINKEFQFVDWLSKETGRKVVLYLHGTLDIIDRLERRKAPPKRNPLVRVYRAHNDPQSYSSVDFSSAIMVICVSRAAESFVATNFQGVKTRVIHNAVDHSWFVPTWEDKNYALCVSRFTREKNLELLLDALNGAPYPVVIHGSLGTGEAEAYSRGYLMELESRKSSNVRIEIHHDDSSMRELVQSCSVFLHPGKNEGFGLAPLEAMSCGKPVIAHNSGGTPECVDHAGILLGDDPGEWRTTVDELMGSADLRREWGEKAYEYSKSFSWDKTTAEVEEVLLLASGTANVVPNAK